MDALLGRSPQQQCGWLAQPSMITPRSTTQPHSAHAILTGTDSNTWIADRLALALSHMTDYAQSHD
jgi:hypothetical protein